MVKVGLGISPTLVLLCYIIVYFEGYLFEISVHPRHILYILPPYMLHICYIKYHGKMSVLLYFSDKLINFLFTIIIEYIYRDND